MLRDGLGVSYYDGSACHLDLVQWATAPKWADLLPDVKERLRGEGVPYLKDQLRFGNLQLVILNGREVLSQVRRVGLARLKARGTLGANTRLPRSLYSGHGQGLRFLGWSTNLQSSRGVTREFKDRLAQWLAEAANRSEARGWNGDRPMSEFVKACDAHGHVVKDTAVATKFELLRLLQTWLAKSDAPNIGGAERGQTRWIFMPLDHGRKVVLNADTNRSAVEEYVKEAQRRGLICRGG